MMDDRRITILRDDKISKAVNTLSAPAIVGMLVMAIYNFVDTVFVSWVDPLATSATQVVLPVMLIASAIGLSLGIGSASYISRLLGMKNKHLAEKVVMTAFVTGIILGLLSTLFNYIYMEDIFTFFGANPGNMTMTLDYGKYILMGYTFMILNMIMNNVLRSEGSAKYQMIAMVTGSVLNIILDPIFIFVFKLGVGGAAMATTISNMVSFIILLSLFLNKRTMLRMHLKNLSFSLSIYKEILVIGLPTLLKQLLFSFSMKLLNTAAALYGGNDLLGTVSIIIKIISVPSYIVFGFGQGFQPVAGYNYGADNPKRVMDSFRYTLKVTTLIMIITAFILSVFGFLVIKIFQTTDIMAEYAIKALRYNSIGLVFLGIINSVTVLFQALGKGFKALLMSIARQGLFFIPIILIIPGFLGIDGVMGSQAMADILSVILAVILVIPYLKTENIEALFQKTH